MAQAVDLLLRGATVYPGEEAPLRADVAVRGDRITAVGRELGVEAARVLELDGLALAPGFVDMHSHSALRPFVEPQLDSRITQGFTTELINQDGVGPAPVTAEGVADRRAYVGVFEGRGPDDWSWRSIGDYLDALDATRPATSLCPLVPHGAVRELVMGGARRAPTARELDAMRGEVHEGMQRGCLGHVAGIELPRRLRGDRRAGRSSHASWPSTTASSSPISAARAAGCSRPSAEMVAVARRVVWRSTSPT